MDNDFLDYYAIFSFVLWLIGIAIGIFLADTKNKHIADRIYTVVLVNLILCILICIVAMMLGYG